MATITGNRVDHDDKTVSVTWLNLVNATSDVGKGVMVADLENVSVQAIGTNATTVELEGSNDGTNWNDIGAGLTLTVGAGGSSPVTAVSPVPRFVRPATPSAAADTDVILTGARKV